MRAIFRFRAQIEAFNGYVADALDELVGAINTQPLYVGTSQIRSGTGTPEGAVTGNVGDVFLRQDGSTITTLYIKTSGTGTNTGWTAK